MGRLIRFVVRLLTALCRAIALTYLLTPSGGSDAKFDIASIRAAREREGTSLIARKTEAFVTALPYLYIPLRVN